MTIDHTSPRFDGEMAVPSLEGSISANVQRNLRNILESIGAAAQRAGRDPDSVRLVAVTKTFPVSMIYSAYEAGARDIGENRIEEARLKVPQANSQTLPGDPIRWHLIGHLQRRKAREAAEIFDLIQSVDSVKLAETLDRHATVIDKSVPILLQVNIANDPNKFGFTPEPREPLFNSIARILELPSLQVQGLMTIGPAVTDAEQARPSFRSLRRLRDELRDRFQNVDWSELSMGMTDDFEVAVSEGATIVRIGRAIFGERI